MIDYAGRSAIDAAMRGEEVVWIGRNHASNRDALMTLAEECEGHGATLRLANGMQSIRFPSGGRIRFFSARNPDGVRGYSADLVVVEPSDWMNNAYLRDNVAPILATTRAGRPRLLSVSGEIFQN